MAALIVNLGYNKDVVKSETVMSKKQLANFFSKANQDERLKKQIYDCGSNNSCVVAVGKKHGHSFSPATVSHWQRDHGGHLV